MKNITISIDEETHRLARIRAAEMNTSVSELVREYLRSLAGERAAVGETERERRRRLMSEVFEDICATRSGFKASDNISREEIYNRHAIR